MARILALIATMFPIRVAITTAGQAMCRLGSQLPIHRPIERDEPAIAARRWPRVYELPAYAPELNPVENVWPTIKGSRANLARRPHRQRRHHRGEEPPQTYAIPHRPDQRLLHRNGSTSTNTPP
ncbi:hypothetical protein [Actinoplanes sp. NPDC051411]|uniref:hypothetical protein n=1 Tax=Actinoplanes sp. NPDC051411 TaxID=3155522 RepID=UPI00342B30C5